MRFTERGVNFCFGGGALMFQHSNDFHANISRTKRGVTLILLYNGKEITILLTRWGMSRQMPLFAEIFPPEYWNNRNRFMRFIGIAWTLFLEVDLYCFNTQMTSTRISAERKEVWLLNRHVNTPLLTHGEFRGKSPFSQRYYLLNI